MNEDELNPYPQDLSAYPQETQTLISNLITEDAAVRAQYFSDGPADTPAQLIGASGFTQGINAAISPATGPI